MWFNINTPTYIKDHRGPARKSYKFLVSCQLQLDLEPHSGQGSGLKLDRLHHVFSLTLVSHQMPPAAGVLLIKGYM